MWSDQLKPITKTSLKSLAAISVPISRPGKPRRVAVATYFLTIAVVCGVIGATVTLPFFAPLLILLLSLFAFQILALWTYDAECGWRRVDYPWVLSATFAVILAIINMDSKFYSNQAETLSRELRTAMSATQKDLDAWGKICSHYMPIVNNDFEKAAEQERTGKVTVTTTYRRSVSELQALCAMESVTTNLRDVDAKTNTTKTVSIEQLSGDDIEHLIGSIESWQECLNSHSTFALHRAIDSETSPAIIVPGAFVVDDLRNPNTSFGVGFTYLALCFDVEKLHNVLFDISRLKRDMGLESGLSIVNWVTQTPWRLRWWYLVFLFCVGLRLGKVTAEIKQVHARSRSAQTHP